MKDSRDKFYDFLDEVTGLNAGWKAFVHEMQKKNDKSNERLFRLFREQFRNDFKSLMKSIGNEHGFLTIVRNPSGVCFNDKRWDTIPQLWIDQRSTSEGMAGSVYIQVKPGRFFKIQY